MERPRENRSTVTSFSGLGWPVLAGLALTSLFYALVFQGPLNTVLAHRYFATHPVSYCATAMFFVGLAALVLRAIEVLAQRGLLNHVRLDLHPDDDAVLEDCPRLLDDLEEMPARQRRSYLCQRLHDAIEFVHRKRSAAGLDDELKYLADMDTARQQEGFGLVRIIIWATPMLGFLGTVIGITQALGDLGAQSELLASDPKSAMQSLLSGLYVAFDTTALALTLSIVLMFIQFVVDRFETQLLVSVDRRVREELTGRFRTEPEYADPHLAVVERMATTVLSSVEQLVRRQTDHWSEVMQQTGGRLQQVLSASGDQLQVGVTEAMERALSRLSDRLEQVEQTTDERMRVRWEQWQSAWAEHAGVLESQQAEMARQGEVLARILAATGDVTRLERALNENLHALAGAKNFEDTVMSLAAAIQLLCGRMGPAAEAPHVELERKPTREQAA